MRKITHDKVLACARDLAEKLGHRDMYSCISRRYTYDSLEKTDVLKPGLAHVFASGNSPVENGMDCLFRIPNIFVSEETEGISHLVCTMDADGKKRTQGFSIHIRNGNIYEASIINKRSAVAEKEMTETLEALLS